MPVPCRTQASSVTTAFLCAMTWNPNSRTRPSRSKLLPSPNKSALRWDNTKPFASLLSRLNCQPCWTSWPVRSMASKSALVWSSALPPRFLTTSQTSWRTWWSRLFWRELCKLLTYRGDYKLQALQKLYFNSWIKSIKK